MSSTHLAALFGSVPVTANSIEQNMACDWGDPHLAFFDTQRSPWVVSCPNTMLRLAVLEDAYRTLLHGLPEPKYMAGAYAETLDWVRGKYRSHPGFSLEDICGLFGLNISYVRRKLLSVVQVPAGSQVHLLSHRNTSHRMQQNVKPGGRMARRRVSDPHKITANEREGRKRNRS